jgi:hypothetical protein
MGKAAVAPGELAPVAENLNFPPNVNPRRQALWAHPTVLGVFLVVVRGRCRLLSLPRPKRLRRMGHPPPDVVGTRHAGNDVAGKPCFQGSRARKARLPVAARSGHGVTGPPRFSWFLSES